MTEEEYWYTIELIMVASMAYYRYTRRKNCNKPRRKPRRFGVKPVYLQRKALGEFTNYFREIKAGDGEMFLKYTRMSSPTYDALLELLKQRLTKKSRLAISPSQRLAFTLRYLSTGATQQSMGGTYRLARSTCHRIVRETCTAIWDILHPIYLKPPTKAEWKTYADGFWETWKVPNCCGSADVKNIIIQSPLMSGARNANLALLAVCDHNHVFRYINIANSSLGTHSNDTLNLPDPQSLPNTPDLQFPYFLVGHDASPLWNPLLHPYPSLKTKRSENIFNYRISPARQAIENSFGMLSLRWGILKKPIIADANTAELIVKACVCLHNYLKLPGSDSNLYCPANSSDREDDGHGTIFGGGGEEVNDTCAIRKLATFTSNDIEVISREQRDVLAEWFSNNEHGMVSWQENVNNEGCGGE